MVAPNIVPGLYRIDPGDGDVDHTLVLSVDPWVAMCVTDGMSRTPREAVEAHGERLDRADAEVFFRVRADRCRRDASDHERQARRLFAESGDWQRLGMIAERLADARASK